MKPNNDVQGILYLIYEPIQLNFQSISSPSSYEQKSEQILSSSNQS